MAEPTIAVDAASLIREGNAALIAGDAYTARQRFRQALDLDPERVEAWIGMAGSVRPYREKRDHLLRALAIDPGNASAQAILAQVEARLAAGEVLAPGGVREREQPGPAEASPPPGPPPATAPDAVATMTCYIHPDRETGLRCTNCERPICADCVRPAPVGQLCPECAKIRRPVNYQVSWAQLAIAGAISVVYSGVVTYLALNLLAFAGWFSFIVAFLLGPMAGDLLIRLIDRATGNKRGRAMQVAVSVGYSFGALPWIGFLLILRGGGLLIGLALFTIIAITAAIARMR